MLSTQFCTDLFNIRHTQTVDQLYQQPIILSAFYYSIYNYGSQIKYFYFNSQNILSSLSSTNFHYQFNKNITNSTLAKQQSNFIIQYQLVNLQIIKTILSIIGSIRIVNQAFFQMTSNSAIVRPYPEMGFSEVYSVGSLDNQIRQIESVYYRMGYGNSDSIRCSHFMKSGEALKGIQSVNSSLQYSNSPNKDSSLDHQKKLFTFQKLSPSNQEINDNQIQIPEFSSKQPLVSQVDKFLINHQIYLTRPPFSAIPLFNPVFKRLEQIRKQFSIKKSASPQNSSNNHGLYPMPSDSILEVVSQSTNQCNKLSMFLLQQERYQNSQNNSQQNKYQESKQNIKYPAKESPKDYKRLIYYHQDSIKQQSQQSLNHQNVYQNQDQINQFLSMNEHYLSQKISEMNYNQVYEEVMKHIKIMEDINNSQISIISNKSYNREGFFKSQANDQLSKYCEILQQSNKRPILSQFELQPQQQINKKPSPKDTIQNRTSYKPKSIILNYSSIAPSQDKYLKSSSNSLTFSQKKQLIRKFNEQQRRMMQILARSISSSKLCQENYNSSKQRNSKHQQNLNHKSLFDERSTYEKQINEKNYQTEDAKHNLKKKRVRFYLENNQMQKIKASSRNVQFKKLEILMKDPQMKKSIVDSLGLDSSHSHSFISILDKDLAVNKSSEQ